jgi:microcystin degradation protein MlrC
LLADEMRSRRGVLSISPVLGFPYADVAEMGSACVAVTDNDPRLAQSIADEMAAYIRKNRQAFRAKFISVDEALDAAMSAPSPVCLLDVGDNVGGGSPADGTVLAAAIHRRQIGPAIVCINDPQVVEQARNVGIGDASTFSVGAKTDNLHGAPLVDTFRVRSLHDGLFSESQPRHGGRTQYDMGPCAVIESTRGLTILLTSVRTPPFSLGQITSCGLDPAAFRLLVAKGVHAPVAAYQAVCKTFVRVNTPGVTSADMSSLPYQHRRRPLFPLEEVSDSDM